MRYYRNGGLQPLHYPYLGCLAKRRFRAGKMPVIKSRRISALINDFLVYYATRPSGWGEFNKNWLRLDAFLLSNFETIHASSSFLESRKRDVISIEPLPGIIRGLEL
jgi:hypothetical protein